GPRRPSRLAPQGPGGSIPSGLPGSGGKVFVSGPHLHLSSHAEGGQGTLQPDRDKERQLKPLGPLPQDEQDEAQHAEGAVPDPHPYVGRQAPLGDEILSSGIEDPVDDRYANAQAEPGGPSAAPVHDP